MMGLLRTAGAVVVCAVLAGCTVEQTEEGRAPEIDPGEAPAFEVQPADVDLEWDTATVRVPDVEVEPERDTVSGGAAPGSAPR